MDIRGGSVHAAVATQNLRHLYEDGGGVSSVSVSVPVGSSLSVIGASGCGKTTLAHMAAGLLKPQAGKLSILPGQCVTLVQQKDALFPWLSAGRNVELGAEAQRHRSISDGANTDGANANISNTKGRLSSGEVKHRSEQLMQQLGVLHCAKRYPAQLSGGERQRISICRALMTGADILILDEPSAALDAFTRERLQDMLLSLQQEKGLTAIYITHNIEEALFLSPRVMVMNRASVHSMYHNPLFPDPRVRSHAEFYSQVLALRSLLNEVMGQGADPGLIPGAEK